MSFIRVLPVGTVSQVIDPSWPRTQFSNWMPAQPGGLISNGPVKASSGNRRESRNQKRRQERLRLGIGG